MSDSILISRRTAVVQLVAAVAGASALGAKISALSPISMTVYKDPNCGCCKAWITHVEQHNFVVDVRDSTELAQVKAALGVPNDLASCHTALVNGYIIEGHVPADLVQQLLRERPRGAMGLFVPGMPAGSPGMEGPPPVRYDITLVQRASGARRVYATRTGRSAPTPARR
jgi:hypothetical protein